MRVILAILLPPVAVLSTGRIGSFFLNLLCCVFFWIPGIVHALFVVADYRADKRSDRQAQVIAKAMASGSSPPRLPSLGRSLKMVTGAVVLGVVGLVLLGVIVTMIAVPMPEEGERVSQVQPPEIVEPSGPKEDSVADGTRLELPERVERPRVPPVVVDTAVNLSVPKEELKPYSIVEDEKMGTVKRSVVVRLEGKISETALEDIANQIVKSSPQKFQRTFIAYLLPGQTMGAGAWATTHFDPELEVRVLGLTEGAADKMAKDLRPGEAEIGRWETVAFPASIIVIVRSGNSYTLRQTFKDGSTTSQAVIPETVGEQVKITPVQKNSFGEYWILDADKSLLVMDAEGLISKAVKR